MRWTLCLVVLLSCLPGCAAEAPREPGESPLPAALGLSREPVRVEPQLAPSFPSDVRFHPTDPSRLLMVEEAGAVSVWDLTNPDLPIRELTLYTNAFLHIEESGAIRQ